MLANSWTPDQWVLVITSVVGSLTAAVTAVITVIKTHGVQQSVKLSNGKSLGEAVEKIDKTQTMAVNNEIEHRQDNIATHDALLQAHAEMQVQLGDLAKRVSGADKPTT